MVTEARGVMLREEVLSPGPLTLRGHAGERDLQWRPGRWDWELGGNQESSDSEGKGRVFLEGQGGPGSDVTVLWDWQGLVVGSEGTGVRRQRPEE